MQGVGCTFSTASSGMGMSAGLASSSPSSLSVSVRCLPASAVAASMLLGSSTAEGDATSCSAGALLLSGVAVMASEDACAAAKTASFSPSVRGCEPAGGSHATSSVPSFQKYTCNPQHAAQAPLPNRATMTHASIACAHKLSNLSYRTPTPASLPSDIMRAADQRRG